MPSIHDVFGGDNLKHADLMGQEWLVTITNCQPTSFTKDDGSPDPKLSISLFEMEKDFICNVTNANIITEMFGDDYTRWVNQQIILYPTRVPFGKKMVDAIRVKEPVVTVNRQQPAPMVLNQPAQQPAHNPHQQQPAPAQSVPQQPLQQPVQQPAQQQEQNELNPPPHDTNPLAGG